MGLVAELPRSGADRRTDDVGGLLHIERDFRQEIQGLKSMATFGQLVDPQCITEHPRIVVAAHAELAGGYAYVKRLPISPVFRTTITMSAGSSSFHVIDAQFEDESVLHFGEYKARFRNDGKDYEVLLWLLYPEWNGHPHGVAGRLQGMLLGESADVNHNGTAQDQLQDDDLAPESPTPENGD